MSKLAENSKLVTLLAFLAIYIIWGSTYLAIKYAIDTVPPLMMAGARFIVAGTSLYIFMRLRGEARPSLQQWGQAAIVGTLLLALGNGGVVLAEKCSYRYVRSFGRDGSRIYCAARTYQQRSSQPENLYWITSWNGRDFYVGWARCHNGQWRRELVWSWRVSIEFTKLVGRIRLRQACCTS